MQMQKQTKKCLMPVMQSLLPSSLIRHSLHYISVDDLVRLHQLLRQGCGHQLGLATW